MGPIQLKKIFIVDDEPDILAVARFTLEKRGGFEVEFANSGNEAIDRIETFGPDLVILDVMMPEMDGPTLLGHLQSNPATSQIPVIFLTAKVQREEVERFQSLGAIGVLSKPFDQGTFSDSIRSIWDSHSHENTSSDVVEKNDPPSTIPLDPELEKRLLEKFLDRLPERIDELLQGRKSLSNAEDQRGDGVLMAAHKLAGTGTTFGFPEISEAGMVLEALIRRHHDGEGRIAQDFQQEIISGADGLIRLLETTLESNRSPDSL